MKTQLHVLWNNEGMVEADTNFDIACERFTDNFGVHEYYAILELTLPKTTTVAVEFKESKVTVE